MQNAISKLSIVAFLTLSTFFSCKKDIQTNEIPQSVSSFVYAYTSGEISKAGAIRVRFTSSLIENEKVGTEVDKGILTFKPKLSGKTVWEDNQTIYFLPDNHLKSQNRYIGKVNLKELFKEVPKDAETFEFRFQVKEQNFNISFGGLRGIDPSDTKNQRLDGYVYTNDIADKEEVEKLLSADYPGGKANIRWEHSGDQMRHDFHIENIERKEEDTELKVSWNGNALGVDKRNSRSFVVPGINNFQMMDARVVQGDDQHILLSFSDPILKAQTLIGLISIQDYTGDLRFTIDGNQLRVYPDGQLNGERKITIESALKNTRQVKLKNRLQWNLMFEEPKPAIRLVGNGTILPNSKGLIFPFEAINLNTVDVEIFKIYNNNILQFLQTNQMDGYYQLEQVGRIIKQKQISLKDLSVDLNTSNWTRYALDLSQMINQDPNAIYQIRMGFRSGYSDYHCADSGAGIGNMNVLDNPFSGEEIQSIWDDNYYGYGGYYDGYDWDQRENPCYPAYYNSENFVRRNVLASNLGIIAKSGTSGEMMFYVTDLTSTNPVSGTQLDVYDYQKQMIKSVMTDGSGIATMQLDVPAFVVVASRGAERGYLKLLDPNSLSLSKFDVAGASTQKGMKGFIYGERGVWRPGDSLYLNFVLEDKDARLPDNHPITFQLYDSRNQLHQKFTSSENINNVYPLKIATNVDDPTGNWQAQVQLGGATFSKTLKIETVKPNRLKIKLDFGKEELTKADLPMNTGLQVNWLHGAPARDLKAKVEMQLRQINTSFNKFTDYEFDDPARKTSSEYQTVFDGSLNNEGFATIKMDLSGNNALPGKMRADFRTRAFEKGGDFSEDNFSVDYHPFDSYAGVSIPQNRYGSKRIDLEKGGTLDFVAVDAKGEPLKNRKLKIGLYRVDWSWWWERDNQNIGLYNTSTHFNAQNSYEVSTSAKGMAELDINVDDWGRYLVRVCDEQSGHCSGDYFYAGYPWWGEDDNNANREAAAMLLFSADKKKYEVGENVEIRIPSSVGGKVLVTLESGSKVIESYWQNTQADETRFSFIASPQMAPTVYAYVSMIQPHGQMENDLPIRMYGVIPINVEDPKTRLNPELKMADVLKPEDKVKIEVSEASGKAMTYTVAVVDDGLLDLTRFKTPNPWDAFYAREALGVKTWDVYDEVLGASGGQMDRILSIGGDAESLNKKGIEKANRFKPVVKHFGPFYLNKGKKAIHEFTMPNYVGSVRTMIVASDNGAYGAAEKTTPVKKPLMLLATLPRVIGPGETLKVPVNIFAMDKKVKDVKVQIKETTGLVNIKGETSKSISFYQEGDQLVNFDIEVSERIGVAKLEVTASGGGEKATQEIEIDVRNPNPYITDVYAEVIESSGNWAKEVKLPGVTGTNTVTLEVSNIPPINLEKRLNFLLQYPHGCVEQTTSSVFPQLYVGEMMELDNQRKSTIANNINAGIKRLSRFQTNNGGLAYWPGDEDASAWGSNYAGHFLLEAKNRGYYVPDNLLSRWKKFQASRANIWNNISDEDGYHGPNNTLLQSYRLYTLALAGSPEFGAMNRLRETKNLPITAKWRLAAAYALAGKPEVGQQIVNKLGTDVEPYSEMSYTYGSEIRDEAMILEALLLLKDKKGAAEMAKTISEQMSKDSWYSTQTTAYSLLALGKFAKENTLDNQLKFAYQVDGGNKTDAGSQKSVMLVDIPAVTGNKKVSVFNTGKGILYSRLIVNGQPLVGDQTEASNKLAITIAYKTTGGQNLNPERIPQGTDFIAEVQVKNPGTRGLYYKEMALSQIFPSGWEITNTRMTNVQNFQDSTIPTYQDIRDDRVYTYFDIASQKTQTYRVQLTAAYEGRYYLPSVSCEAMYDHTINARKAGKWVEVTSPGEAIAFK